MTKCWTCSLIFLCAICIPASPATLERNHDNLIGDDAQEGKEEPLQPVPKMLGSAEGISDMGSVAHVLALDVLDAVKEVATTRWHNYLATQPRQERNLFSRIVSSSIPNDYDDRDGLDDGFLTDGESGYILDEELDSDYNWYNTIIGRLLLLFGYSRNDVAWRGAHMLHYLAQKTLGFIAFMNHGFRAEMVRRGFPRRSSSGS